MLLTDIYACVHQHKTVISCIILYVFKESMTISNYYTMDFES